MSAPASKPPKPSNRYSQSMLLFAAEQALQKASHRSGPARQIAVLCAQACTAAAQLGDHEIVSEDCADTLPWVPNGVGWEEP